VKESKVVQQETLKHFLRSTDMPRSLNSATASPVIFLTIYRRTANAKNVRTNKMNDKIKNIFCTIWLICWALRFRWAYRNDTAPKGKAEGERAIEGIQNDKGRIVQVNKASQ